MRDSSCYEKVKCCMKIYLLDCSELQDEQTIAGIEEELSRKCDAVRLEKAERIRSSRQRCISLSAGVLLQKVWRDYDTSGVESPELWSGTLRELLGEISTPMQLRYRMSEQGKPYFEELPIFFSLSHSQDYVLCVVDEREVGADIQWKEAGNILQIAERFFAEPELERAYSLPKTEQETYLYQLWTGKEAYGKLTGKGVADCLAQNVADLTEIDFFSTKTPDGYAISICRHAQMKR